MSTAAGTVTFMSDPTRATFPTDFLWGAGTASYQVEGGFNIDRRGPSIWDKFAHTRAAHGHSGDVASDQYHRLEQDVELMSGIGLRSYRFSISWSRVMPDGRGSINTHGLAFYERLVELLLQHDIIPCATLFHWDLPLELEYKDGFRNRDTVGWFTDFAALMADRLGDRVSMWSTVANPWSFAYLGHAAGTHAPGITDDAAALAVAHHQLLAHGMATQAMRAERNGLDLGIVLDPTNIRRSAQPRNRPASLEDALRHMDGLRNRWWFDALLTGHYPDDITAAFGRSLDIIRPGDGREIAQPLDWVGLDYFGDSIVTATPPRTTGRSERTESEPDRVANDHRMPEYPLAVGVMPSPSATGGGVAHPMTPDGLTELLVRLHTDYPNLPPIYITANGCAGSPPIVNGTADDRQRREYLDAHLMAVHEAIVAGVDVRGYFVWSLLDGFDWDAGYGRRFGLIDVDSKTLERTPRMSARWYSDVITANGLAPVD